MNKRKRSVFHPDAIVLVRCSPCPEPPIVETPEGPAWDFGEEAEASGEGRYLLVGGGEPRDFVISIRSDDWGVRIADEA